MKKNFPYGWQFTGMLFLMLLAGCSSGPDKRDHPPPPAPPTCFLPISGHIYGKPKEIRETCISDRKPKESITTIDWALRKSTYSSEITYLGTDFRPDSTVSTDGKEFQHYFKTPYYKYYFSFSHTKEQTEDHFSYELDTANRQVRELHSDTSEYSIDYFDAAGFLVHRYVNVNYKDRYHLYYTNDNHGNPVEERIVLRSVDFIQTRYYYDYDKEGNWVAKDLYHYYQDGQSFKMQFRRKLVY